MFVPSANPYSVFSEEGLPVEVKVRALEILLEQDGSDPQMAEFMEHIKTLNYDLAALFSKTHEPVGIEEFVTSEYFLNLRIVDLAEDGKQEYGGGVWRPVFEAAKAIVEGGYVEALFVGAIGTGKTSAAQIVLAYNLYKLSCEESPHLKFGIIPKNDIYYVCLNVTDDLAYNVTFKGFRGLIENSPYFNNEFPFDKSVSSSLRFPKKIIVAPFAAYAKKMMGMDVLGGIVDELNFMQSVKQSKRAKNRQGGEFKQAVEIYNGMVRRLKSRFDTDDISAPVTICLVSSKAHHGDFTETREKEALRENDAAIGKGRRPLTYVYKKAQWEAKPDPKFLRGTPFFVEIGDGRYPSRILREMDIPREGARVVEVPEYFKEDFERDLEGAIADFIGESAGGTDAFFYDKVKIWEMNDSWKELGYQNPFLDNDVRSDEGWPRVNPNYSVPNPDRPRAAHIDLALSGDCVGISVGHVYKVSHGKVIDRSTGKHTIEAFPHVAYDQVLIVRPPRAGQIELAEMRSIIYFLRDTMKIPIRWVTYDGFESADSRQILRKQGFKTDRISVENRDTYMPFRTAMFYHQRIACAEHERVFTELSEVSEVDPEKGKIDHPAGGSKDGADSMVGVFTMLMKTPSSWKAELMEIDDTVEVTDRFSEREKAILGEYADKEPPRGSIAARIKSRRSVARTRRSTRAGRMRGDDD